MAIGLCGFIVLESFKTSFNSSLERRSKNILGADVSVGGRLAMSEKKRQEVAKFLQAKEYVFVRNHFSMIRIEDRNQLVYLDEYHPNFPYYGGLKLRSGEISPGGKKLSANEIWIYPELLFQLKSEVGDKVKIGEAEFTIADVIEEDSSQTFQMGALAPKILINSEGLKRTQLFGAGSTGFYTTYFKTDLTITKETQEQLNELINDTSQRVTTPKESSEQVGRVAFFFLLWESFIFTALISLTRENNSPFSSP
jgi:putative ABC transport system permease protein